MELDHRRCYRAVASRDTRFDGAFFTAVRTTGIYCRPSCPATTPRESNVEFFSTAGGAQRAGYRACKRCIPDAAPGSPNWNRRGDVVARAMRLIDDGVVDRDGVDGLATRLGYSTRHVHRLMCDEVGVGPLAIARARRAHTARSLLESTDLSISDIAFAAGFTSIRQFNDTIQAVYASSPSQLRTSRRGDGGAITVRLAVRRPFALDHLFRFLAARAIDGVELASDRRYRRTLGLPHGHAIADIVAADDGNGVVATLHLADVRDLTPAVTRIRRLFDLDADPVAIDDQLGAETTLAPLVAATPGLRAPASVDAFEAAVRAIVGQQVSVAGARTVTARLVAAVGAPLGVAVEGPEQLTHVFPSPEQVAAAPDDAFAMPTGRAATLRAVAAGFAAGDIRPDGDPADVRERLLSYRGVGPWTADYVVMRGLAHPDIMLPTDLGVRRAVEHLGIDIDDPSRVFDRWSPWRTYALHHLWNAQERDEPDRHTPHQNSRGQEDRR